MRQGQIREHADGHLGSIRDDPFRGRWQFRALPLSRTTRAIPRNQSACWLLTDWGWGRLVTQTQHGEANYRDDFAIYLGLTLALFIGISGAASILDGFALDHFLQRHPRYLSRGYTSRFRGGATCWPASWPAISSSAIDLFVVWSAFYLAVNIGDLKINGKTFVRNATAGSGYLEFVAIVFFSFIFIPLVVLYMFAFSGKHLKSNEAKVPLIYVVVLITVVASLALLNWQLRGVA